MNTLVIRTFNFIKAWFCLAALVMALSVQAETGAETESQPLSEVVVSEQQVPEREVSLSVEELKKQVIKLNRDLFILEEDLLFPANTQFVVYLSLATGKFLALDSVTLKVDNEIVAAHLYTERQLEALKRGGMQRLHIGNLKTGAHEITAILHGIGPNKEDYKLAATQQIEKNSELKAIEIRIEDQSENYQPSVQVIEWEQ